LRWADHSSKEAYRLCKKDYETEEEARAQQRDVEPLMDEVKLWFASGNVSESVCVCVCVCVCVWKNGENHEGSHSEYPVT
jgi:hypothetical protein